MSFADHNPGYAITTEEEAINWITELIELAETARAECDIQTTASDQRAAYSKFMIRHGSALGTLTALHRCNKINDRTYNEFQQRALNSLAASVIRTNG